MSKLLTFRNIKQVSLLSLVLSFVNIQTTQAQWEGGGFSNPFGHYLYVNLDQIYLNNDNATNSHNHTSIWFANYEQGRRLFYSTNDNSFNFTHRLFAPGLEISGKSNFTEAVNFKDGLKSATIEVTSSNWADYVFEDTYNLQPLEDVENYIKENHHLPNIPSKETIIKEGYIVQEMNVKMMAKIEELFLHTIEQQKQLKEQAALIKELQDKLNQ